MQKVAWRIKRYDTADDFPEVSKAERHRMKLSYLELLERETIKKIEDLRIEAAREAKKGKADSAKVCLLWADSHTKELRDIRARIAVLKSPNPGRIDDLRDRARQIPLTQFLRAGKISCIYHEDRHPSAYNYGQDAHCFSCGRDFDAIAYIMQTENLSFVEAIKRIA
ncbi:MAG: hypothetical protein KGL39_14340 [Patescibacteria group bacterium]|nr:hypothetical protein [Patescibacteria group bacterium]